MEVEKIAKLTPKQKRFCEEYIIDFNATQAAIRAGYSEKTARFKASNQLTKVNVQQYIAELRKMQSERTQITADMVLNELAAIAFADRTEISVVDEKGVVSFAPTNSISANAKKAIAGIKEGKFGPEVSSYDKVKALELLGKHLGIFDKRDNSEEALSKLDDVLDKIRGDL